MHGLGSAVVVFLIKAGCSYRDDVTRAIVLEA